MLKFGFVGVGQYGGKLANQFAAYKIDEKPAYPSLAFNTTSKDYEALNHIHTNGIQLSKEERIGGAGKDPLVAQELAVNNHEALAKEMLDRLFGLDQIFFSAGLGGGTGTGAMPVLVQLALANRLPCSMIVTIPETGEDAVVKANALQGLVQVGQLSLDYGVPFMIIDNNRIRTRIGQENISWPDVDKEFAQMLHTFNMAANQASAYRTFDEMDYLRLFSTGGVMHLTSVELDVLKCINNPDAPLSALRSAWDKHPFFSIDVEKALQVGVVIEVPAKELHSYSSSYIDAIDRMQRIFGAGRGSLYAGLYPSSGSKVKISALLAGIPFPAERLQQLKDEVEAGEKAIEESHQAMQDSFAAFGGLGGFKRNPLTEKKKVPTGLSLMKSQSETVKKPLPVFDNTRRPEPSTGERGIRLSKLDVVIPNE